MQWWKNPIPSCLWWVVRLGNLFDYGVDYKFREPQLSTPFPVMLTAPQKARLVATQWNNITVKLLEPICFCRLHGTSTKFVQFTNEDNSLQNLNYKQCANPISPKRRIISHLAFFLFLNFRSGRVNCSVNACFKAPFNHLNFPHEVMPSLP